MTDPDPNETARMPTPGDAGATPTEGWPGTTGEPEGAPPSDAHAAGPSVPSDAPLAADTELPAGAEPPFETPGPFETPPPFESRADPVPPLAAFDPVARRRNEPDHGRAASVVFGLILLAIGFWFFAEHTLGLELPRIRWSQFWPVILIGLGVWIVLGSMRRGSR